MWVAPSHGPASWTEWRGSMAYEHQHPSTSGSGLWIQCEQLSHVPANMQPQK